MEERPKFRVLSPLDGVRVLLVEDDFFILTELEFILADAGAEIVGACRTMKDALLIAKKGDFDAAILDVRIGSETVGPVAQQLSDQGIPFLFYTGQGPSDPICQNWADHRIIAKPARQRDLVAAVRDLVKR